ncbi:MAG TPA: TonB family protein [Candidatus Acidoferrales bacterium]|nr:TonB family protein [Candidatus Acidoferrales bacterium]
MDSLHPRFAVPWQRGAAQRIWDNFCSIYAEPPAPREFAEGENFRGCSITSSVPRRSMFTSFIWHSITVLLLIQFGSFLWTPLHVAAMPDFELTWSGPVEDLPALTPPGQAQKITAPGDPAKPLPRRGADTFHPRQTIISAPKVPTHPRQTLIQPDAPPVAPKVLPPLPNMVNWQPDEPARPKLEISAKEFARMHPNQPVPQQNRDVAVPELPNQERNPADLNISNLDSLPDPARPALRIKSGSSAVSAPKQVPTVASSSDPAPEVGAGNNQRVIAISSMPAAVPPPPQMPAGNLSSRVSISPDGKQPGVPGGSPNGAAGDGGAGGDSASPGGTGNATGGGNGSPSGVSISGGNPRNSSGTSGLGGSPSFRNSLPSLHITPGAVAHPNSSGAAPPAPKPADASLSGRLQPGEPPEHIFGQRTFYTMHVTSPNVSSKMGSWVLNFAELDDDGSPAAISRRMTGTLAGPVPTHKVDPPYPPEMIKEHVQGEVVLYAIIRENGAVDSIQVLRPLDPMLDENAVDALAKWKFQPASRNGVPVAVEAVVHIPFHITRPD